MTRWIAAFVAVAACGHPVAPDRASPASSTLDAGATPPPDIVVILTDDLDERTLADAEARGWLPNLASLRNGGTTFTRSFVTLSLCCPSRASLLTGSYPHNTGVLSNKMPQGSVEAFDDTATLATWLQARGYFTAHIGKYLNRYGKLGIAGPGPLGSTYVPPGWSSWQATVDPTTYRLYDYTINHDGELIEYGSDPDDYQTDVLAARAAETIRAVPAGQPLFAVVTPLATHVEAAEDDDEARELIRPAPRHAWVLDEPIDIPRPPSFDEADVADKADPIARAPRLGAADEAYLRDLYRGRAGSLLAVDDLIGEVIGALEASGRLSRTVIVFTSDNGWLYGEHRLTAKRYQYEESIRVPLVVRDFRRDTAPAEIGELALNIDLAPTILAWAAIEPPASIDGRSLVPLLDGAAPDWRRRFLVRGPAHSAIDFVGVRTAPSDPSVPDSLYVRFRGSCAGLCEELYRLPEDPFQLDSALTRDPAAGRELRGWVRLLESCRGDDCRRIESCPARSGC